MHRFFSVHGPPAHFISSNFQNSSCNKWGLVQETEKKTIVNPIIWQINEGSGLLIRYQESKSIPHVSSITWVYIYTMSCCQYHESMFIPWVYVYNKTPVHVNTISPRLYHEYMSISWDLVNSMGPCQFYVSMSIPCVLSNYMS